MRHHAGTSVNAAGSSQATSTTEPAPTRAPEIPVAAASEIDLPHTAPAPAARYEVAAAQTAYTDTPAVKSENPLVAAQPAEMPQPTKVKTVAIKGNVAVPTPAPAYMPEQPEENSVDQLTTASVPAAKVAATPAAVTEKAPAGWVVQIGVSSSKDAAMDLLENAKTKGGKALRSAKPFAVAYANDGEQIYRARFGGFDDQRDAVNACKALKRAGVKCWAAAQ